MDHYTPSTTHLEVMDRVKTVHSVRMWINSPVVSGVVALGLMFFTGNIVSLGHFFANTLNHSTLYDDWSYMMSSFLHTRTIVQILAVLIVLVAGLVVVNSARFAKRIFIKPFRPAVR